MTLLFWFLDKHLHPFQNVKTDYEDNSFTLFSYNKK